jgi:hypothetical protein
LLAGERPASAKSIPRSRPDIAKDKNYSESCRRADNGEQLARRAPDNASVGASGGLPH